MLHKFKMTASVTLLLIGVFVLPYAGNVADVNAENYNCSGSKKEVRQCLKAVIGERDATIGDLEAQLDAAMSKIENNNRVWHEKELERLKEVQMVKDEAERAKNVADRQECEQRDNGRWLVCERPSKGAGGFLCRLRSTFASLSKKGGDGCRE